jgi:hypothetical protein
MTLVLTGVRQLPSFPTLPSRCYDDASAFAATALTALVMYQGCPRWAADLVWCHSGGVGPRGAHAMAQVGL